MSEQDPTSRPERWRVLVVRVEPGREDDVRESLPSPPSAGLPLQLPLVTRVTSSALTAQQTAERLRENGAVVMIVGEPSEGPSAFCEAHPGRIAARRCMRCGAPVCLSCRAAAGDEDVCPACWAKVRTPRRRVKQRQLFVLFLFVVFLYELWRWWAADQAATSPHGPVRVGLYQFVPPERAQAPIVRHLNDRSPAEPWGRLDRIVDVAPWFDAERARYGGPQGYLHLETHGPWPGTPTLPPSLQAEDPPLLGAWRALRTTWALAEAARARGVDPDEVAVRLYVIYSDSEDDLAAHSRGSPSGRLAVVYVDLDEANPGYAALTIAHELAHTLGALDLYDDQSLAQFPEGFIEPWSDPLYPQRWAELMAVDRPVGPGVELEPRGLDEVRVGHRTAADMRWISREDARRFYLPAALGPLDGLPAAEPEADGADAPLAPVAPSAQ